MIKRLSEMTGKHYEHNCGGKLYVDAVRFLEPEEAANAGSFFGRVTMVPGASIGYHEQQCEPAGDVEVYYLIEGEYLVTFNGESYTAGPGDVVICRNGDWNGMENIGTTTAVFLTMILRDPDKWHTEL